ncbi:MAG: protein kinase [Stenotrophobium sp.]
MSGYDAKSCNALEKPYYRPIEVAIRWCNLIQHEPEILLSVGDAPLPSPSMFPHWPCLRANAERVLEAVLDNVLPYGRDGRTVPEGEQVAKHRLTIRHADLKAWMAKHYPGQKPAFLFDETERATHAAINADSFHALQADREALVQRLEKAKSEYLKLKASYDKEQGEIASLRAMADKQSAPGERAEATYLNIIGGLLSLMLGKSPAGKPHSVFDSQAAIISALLVYHEGKPGIAARTLEEKFAAAKRSISS